MKKSNLIIGHATAAEVAGLLGAGWETAFSGEGFGPTPQGSELAEWGVETDYPLAKILERAESSGWTNILTQTKSFSPPAPAKKRRGGWS